MQNVMRRRAVLMRRHLATQQQGDWTAVAARDYASHRQAFQADYARDCWRRSQPTAGRGARRRAGGARARRRVRLGRVYKGAGGATGASRRSSASTSRKSDMVAHAERANAHERVSYAVANLATAMRLGVASLCFQVATSTMALHWPGPDPFLSGPF